MPPFFPRLSAQPRPIAIPGVMTIATLADVRALMRQLPAGHHGKATWRYVAAKLEKAVAGADVRDVSIALQMVLSLDGVEYRIKKDG
jgi:hypothetical protein